LRLKRTDGIADTPLALEWIATPALDQEAPSPSAFYHAIQASAEFQAIDAWAIATPTEAAATLLDRAMNVTLEAKSYAEKFGGQATSFDAMAARLNQFIAALDPTTDYGGTDKAAIVARIEIAIADAHLPITLA
jgi:hypothetical protein